MRACWVAAGALAVLSGSASASDMRTDLSTETLGADVIQLPAAPPVLVPDLSVPLEKTMSQTLPDGDQVNLYAGYPGLAALGPTVDSQLIATLGALQAPGGQNWLDSGYMAYGVVTAGLNRDDSQFEISRFAGHASYAGPYDIAHLNSTAVRFTRNLDSNWTLQGSWGTLVGPESYAPDIVETRWTTSARYTGAFGKSGTWSTMLAWGLKQESVGANLDLNAVTVDTECRPFDGFTLFAHGGIEQDNALLAGGALDPAGVSRSGSLSLGAVHDWTLFGRVKVGAGGLYAFGLTQQPSGASMEPVGHSPDSAAQAPVATPVGNARGAVAYLHVSIR